MGRFLGIDYGTKRIGLAISDENGSLAFPEKVIFNDKNIFEEIEQILKGKDIEEIIIGESLNSEGKPNKVNQMIDLFKKELENHFHLPVRGQKEFFTSFEAQIKVGKEKNDARQIKKEKKEKNDAQAAALILQRYLDRINQNGK